MKKIIKRTLLFLFRVLCIPQPQHPSYAKPGLHLRWTLGFLRAQLIYRPLWGIKHLLNLGPKITWGQRIVFLSSVRVNGNGHIIIGDNVIFDSKPDLYTHGLNSILTLGENSYINGTRFGCSLSISIGKNCILADARLMDTDFHSIGRHRINPEAPVMQAAITIDDDVWLAAGSAVLKGVNIGKHSIVSFGSVVVTSIPEGKIYGGIPAKEIGDVP
ncbi:MAG: acyltransferase [Pseudobdellovibrio sp.]